MSVTCALGAGPEGLAAQLTDAGDALSCACADLARDPTPDKCDILHARLIGVAQHVTLLQSALLAQNVGRPV
jgi:hypothetical protein